MTPQEAAEEKLVQLVAVDGGVLALTNHGRLFFRELDSRANMNSGPHNPNKYRWTLQGGPPVG